MATMIVERLGLYRMDWTKPLADSELQHAMGAVLTDHIRATSPLFFDDHVNCSISRTLDAWANEDYSHASEPKPDPPGASTDAMAHDALQCWSTFQYLTARHLLQLITDEQHPRQTLFPSSVARLLIERGPDHAR